MRWDEMRSDEMRWDEMNDISNIDIIGYYR